MRISSGEKKGRELKRGKPSVLLRPVTDKIKNAIFSIIFDKVVNAQVLDMFAGTGIFGLEALSRGAQGVTFVDKNYPNIKLIRENAQKFQFDERITVINRDFRKAIEFMGKIKSSFSLVFIDPPYNTDFAYQTITHPSFLSLIKPESLVIVRVHHKTGLPSSVGSMHVIDERKYGEAKVYFYKSSPSICI
jgi:16S rRNA (guanine966-N2)-methyltransferase